LRVRVVGGAAVVFDRVVRGIEGFGAAGGRTGGAVSSRVGVFAAGRAAFDCFGAAAGGDAGTPGEASPAVRDCVPTSVALAVLRRRRGAAATGVAGAASRRGVDGGGAVGGASSAGGAVGFLRRAISGLRSP
jgi:hypothetical protein